jgi:hypothetical protein
MGKCCRKAKMIKRFFYYIEFILIVAVFVWLVGGDNVLRGIAEHLMRISGK